MTLWSAPSMDPKPNPLAEALSGLLLLAQDRPRAEHPRLIEQFLAQYPEIVFVPSRTPEAGSLATFLLSHYDACATQAERDLYVDTLPLEVLRVLCVALGARGPAKKGPKG